MTARSSDTTMAVVHAGGVETPYLRAGRGDAIVVVTTDLENADVLRTLAVLSREFLVFVAAPTLPERASIARWLPGFLECLGVASAHLLLHGAASSIVTGGDLAS